MDALRRAVVIGAVIAAGGAARAKEPPAKDYAAIAAEGRVALDKGDALRAVDLLSDAASGLPQDASLRLSLALALERTRQLGPAADTLLEALDIDDSDPRLHLRLGIVYVEMRKPELSEWARKEFAHSLERGPLNGDRALAWYYLGHLDEDAGKTDAALADYRAAVAADPANADASNDLGLVLAAAGKFDEAIPLYRKALATRPAFAIARLNLGVALLRTGDKKSAKAELQKLLALPETDPVRHEAQKLLAN